MDAEMLGAIGTWAGALATFFAVAVALRQSRMAYRTRVVARISEGENIITMRSRHSVAEYRNANLSIANIGLVTVVVSHVVVKRRGGQTRKIPVSTLCNEEYRAIGPGEAAVFDVNYGVLAVKPGRWRSSLRIKIVEVSGREHDVDVDSRVREGVDRLCRCVAGMKEGR